MVSAPAIRRVLLNARVTAQCSHTALQQSAAQIDVRALFGERGGAVKAQQVPGEISGAASTSQVRGGHNGRAGYQGREAGIPRSKARRESAQKLIIPNSVKAPTLPNNPSGLLPNVPAGWKPTEGMIASTQIELPDEPIGRAPRPKPEFSEIDQLKHLDPVFQAVALVPWMPNNEEGQKRRDYITSSVIDQLETKGWDVRGQLKRIWEGERDLSVVLEGKDSGTRAALTSIMYHVKKHDQELGDWREYSQRTK